MTSTILTGLNILAAGGGGSKGEGGSPFDLMVPLLLMGVIFYFLLIRPQRMQRKKLEAEIGGMKTGDKVISAGGIHGLVSNVKDKVVVVKVADNVKMVFEKSSISSVIPKGVAETAEREATTKDEDDDGNAKLAQS